MLAPVAATVLPAVPFGALVPADSAGPLQRALRVGPQRRLARPMLKAGDGRALARPGARGRVIPVFNLLKPGHEELRRRELNPGLPRDRRKY